MNWLLLNPHDFGLLTEHHNLILRFDSLEFVFNLSQKSAPKLLHWNAYLRVYIYGCEHFKSEESVLADFLDSWSVPSTVRRQIAVPVKQNTTGF